MQRDQLSQLSEVKPTKEKSRKNVKTENNGRFTENEDNKTYRKQFIKKISKQSHHNFLDEMEENQEEEKPRKKSTQKITVQKGQRTSQKIDVNVHLNVNNGVMVNPTETNSAKNRIPDLDKPPQNVTPKPNVRHDSVKQTKSVPKIKDYNADITENPEITRTKKHKKTSTTSRRYTLEDYKAIQDVPELPKSLGPDWVEIEEKSKALNRKSLYSHYVSAKNANISRVNKVPVESKHCSKWQKSRQYGKGTYLYLHNS